MTDWYLCPEKIIIENIYNVCTIKFYFNVNTICEKQILNRITSINTNFKLWRLIVSIDTSSKAKQTQVVIIGEIWIIILGILIILHKNKSFRGMQGFRVGSCHVHDPTTRFWGNWNIYMYIYMTYTCIHIYKNVLYMPVRKSSTSYITYF